MNPLNNYRFGSYAILAMGLINLRYQTGNDSNLSKSLVLIILEYARQLICQSQLE